MMIHDAAAQECDLQHLRGALPTYQGTRTMAIRAATVALAALDRTFTAEEIRTLAHAIVDAVETGVHLRGVAFAYDVIDRWTNDTDRLLIQPATAKVADNPDHRPVLDVLQHEYLGVCQARRELANTLLRLGDHWLRRDHQPQPAQECIDVPVASMAEARAA